MREGGGANDLLERLAADKAWQVPIGDLKSELKPSSFTGRAAEQVDEFLAEVIAPLLSAAASGDNREEPRV
jgi:adenylosuccinate lyase